MRRKVSEGVGRGKASNLKVQVETIGSSCAGALSYRRAMGKIQRKCECIKSRAVKDQRERQDVRRR